jgi:hypothetical protein
METYQLSYDEKSNFYSKTTFNITHYVDLIHTMILEVELPQITATYI